MSIRTFKKLIDTCENTSGKGSRSIITDAIKALDADGRKLCFLALNPYITFGIKQVPEIDFSSLEDGPLDKFFELCQQLQTRQLTGNQARIAIIDCLEEYTPKTIDLLSRVLRKNLQANFNTKTYNSAVPDVDKIPTFEVMLADKCEDDDQMLDVISGGGIIADYKYDGVRTILVANGTNFTFYSREGVEMPYCQGLFDEDLTKILDEIGPFVLDSEQFSGSWEETMNARKGGDNSAKQNMGLKAFFIMPYDDWVNQSTEITMKQNRENIEKIFTKIKPKKIVISDSRIVNSIDEIKSMLQEVTTPGFDNQPKGYEGLILKNPNAVYQWKRVMDWCKVKNFYDVDMQVIEILPGRPNTKYSGKMGKVLGRGYLEDGTLVQGLIGSGFTDHEREFYYNNPQEIIGRTIVCSYQEVTKPSAKSPIPNLRFCTFVRIRDDKTVIIDEE